MKTILFLLVFISSGYLFGQQPNIKVKNLIVLPSVNYITVDSIEFPDSLMNIHVAFKVDTLINADSIFFKIGPTAGSSQTEYLKYEVVSGAGGYTLEDGTNSIPFYESNVYLVFAINTKNFDSYLFYEVWGKDNDGDLTPIEKFNF